MNILIVGKSGSGKSNLGDLVRNAIFKLDSDSAIQCDDPDRSVKSLGSGSNKYFVSVRQLKDEESLGSLAGEELDDRDIVIFLGTKKFLDWFRNVYS